MKLLECYVDNFGKLSSFSHSFEDGLNLIIGKNGCGKTTLSVFIKTMLFGFEIKKNTKEETDRKRYFPWQGGRYGGSLTFENEGKRYRIERSFGHKPSEDSFAVYDVESGTISSAFTEKVGEELFGIDADGFERTVFLSEKKFAVNGGNPKVAAKLSNLVGVDGDMGSYDNAIDMLEKREKYYRHRRGKGGLIGDINAEISELDLKIMELTRKKGEHSEIEKELGGILRALEDAEKKRSELEAKRLRLAYEEEYRAKLNSVKTLTEKLNDSKAFFSEYTPTVKEVRDEEIKHNRVVLLTQTLDSLPKEITPVSEEDIKNAEAHISALDNIKNVKKANNSYQISLFLAIISLLSAIACGIVIHFAFFAISLLCIPFTYLFIRGLGARDKAKKRSLLEDGAATYLREKTGQIIHPDMIYSRLNEYRAELMRRKSENERSYYERERISTELRLLSESCNTFLGRFPTLTDDIYGEIRERLSACEAIKRQLEDAERSARAYAVEKGLDPASIDIQSESVKIDEEVIGAAILEVKSLSAARYSLENKLFTLAESISMEDVLNEERLELTDQLKKAEGEHAVTIKAAEHLRAAKERLTSKYLGKMRAAFTKYVNSIAEESEQAFSLDTDFSLMKTENGLTNKIGSYSLGTQEIYSLITRLALVDALYEGNLPFIILDDPFCHFDDRRCAAAIRALEAISKDKQIIYLTCSDSRAPK